MAAAVEWGERCVSEASVRYELRESTGILWIDDGKVNALTREGIDACLDGLDRAEKEAQALLIVGRPGCFSAGFDLSVLRQGGDALSEMFLSGAELALRLYAFPCPVVIACTGHAIAMGAILCLSADARIGADGDYKIGLNEVAIGLALPELGTELARERLSKRHLDRAVLQAQIYTPREAVDAGFLDRVTPQTALIDESIDEAHRLASLDSAAHRNTKLRLRGDAIARIRDSLPKLGDMLTPSR
jgi:enoyl-CoA hydratase